MATLITQQPSKTWSGARLNRLNQQTALLLRETQAAAGVRAVCILDNGGALLAAGSSEDLQASVLTRMATEMSHVLAVLQGHGEKSKDVELRFQRGGIYMRNLGNAVELILCAPQVNWSLLRMTVNVAASAFEKDIELQNNLGAAAAATAPHPT